MNLSPHAVHHENSFFSPSYRRSLTSTLVINSTSIRSSWLSIYSHIKKRFFYLFLKTTGMLIWIHQKFQSCCFFFISPFVYSFFSIFVFLVTKFLFFLRRKKVDVLISSKEIEKEKKTYNFCQFYKMKRNIIFYFFQ